MMRLYEIDRANMFKLVREFPAQVAEALEIGAKAERAR